MGQRGSAVSQQSVVFSRELPVHDDWEVVVVGGGPAGCAAAAAAAREGARTLLIESTGALGGMSTNGLVPSWAPFSDLEKIIYRGIARGCSMPAGPRCRMWAWRGMTGRRSIPNC